MTDAERETIQKRVERLHRHWSKDREYFAPPASGQLADLDPALIVTPPPGLENGYAFSLPGDVQIYNLATDVGEKQNVAADHPDRVAALQAKLANFLKDAVKPGNPD